MPSVPDRVVPNEGGAGISAVVGFVLKVADEINVSVALPTWYQLTVTEVIGDFATIDEDGAVLVDFSAPLATVEMRTNLLHKQGRSVFFGRSWDDGPIEQFAQVDVNSNSPVFFMLQKEMEITSGVRLKLFISTNYAWSGFSWSGTEFVALSETSIILA